MDESRSNTSVFGVSEFNGVIPDDPTRLDLEIWDVFLSKSISYGVSRIVIGIGWSGDI